MNCVMWKKGLVALLAGLALVAGGCATDEEPEEEAAASPTTESEAAGDAMVLVTAVDYAYQNLPATVPAGTTLGLTNVSSQEIHELVAFRLPEGEERSPQELLDLGVDDLMALVGGPPATVLVAPPDGAPQIAAVGDGTLSEPGRYLIMCAIPTGADPQEFLAAAQASGDEPPDVEGGPPHFTQGMFGEITVE